MNTDEDTGVAGVIAVAIGTLAFAAILAGLLMAIGPVGW